MFRRLMEAGFTGALILLLLSSCGAKGETRLLWSKAQVPLPAAFGYVEGVAKTDHAVYISSYTALGRWNEEDNTVELLDTVCRDDAPAMVYGVSGFGDTVYLLTGELLPHYTEDGEARENPDFSGAYRITAYLGETRGAEVDFRLTASEVLRGLAVLSETEAVCWTDNCVWVVRLSDGEILGRAETEGTLTVAMESGADHFLCGESGGENGCYPLLGGGEVLGEFLPAEELPRAVCAAAALDDIGCFGDDEGLYAFDPGQGTASPLLRWGDMHLFGLDICAAMQTGENAWLCVSRVDGGLYRLMGEEVSANRKELHIASTGEEDVVLDALVTAFNEQSEGYVAVVDRYPFDAYDRLCTEMMAGDGPDVLNLQGFSMPLDTPYLEDLYPYIDGDAQLSREIFVPTVLSSLTFHDALRSLPADFTITTLTMAAGDAEGRQSWTFEEMRQMLEDKGEGYHLFPSWMDRNNLLLAVADTSTGRYIDWETGTAHFDCEEFRDYLRFCGEMHTITSSADGGRALDTPAAWPCLAQLDVIQNTQTLNQITANWGAPVTFIGFPRESGSGSYFGCSLLRLAISAHSDEKEAAWQFIRAALTQEAQEQLAQQYDILPVRADVLETLLETDVPDVACRKQFRELVSQPHRFANTELPITDILREESAAYFDGSKSAEEVSALIQNRVTLYLRELG